MIDKLYIKNYLIIKEAEVEFSKGLNILTGETGAGKSIILDALSMILGERADFSLIRKGESKLIIEGSFDFKDNKHVYKFLKSRELDVNEGYVIIRRELSDKGVSRNFINDTPIQLGELKEFGDIIIDIHSQNEHQSLLRKDTHLAILDNFIGDNKLIRRYIEDFEVYKGLITEYEDMLNKRNTLKEKKDIIEFQLKEINNVNPQAGEEEELKNELNKLENVEDISLSVDNSLRILYEDEHGTYGSLSQALKELKNAQTYDSDFSKLVEDLESSYVNIKEAADFLNNYKGGINFDPLRIEQIRDRLGSLNFLKKKYNLSIDELIDKAEELTKELNLSENYDYELEQSKKKVNESKELIYSKAVEISELRKKHAKDMEKSIDSYLKEVGLESAEFKVNFDYSASVNEGSYTYFLKDKNIILSRRGMDDVEFMVKINKGTELSPLRKTASGGEVSRVMLAIKASLSGRDNVPILVFDEIDAGISGRIAGKVGKVMQELSKEHQIIAITHLPQIAAASDRHFYIEKIEEKGHTTTSISVLNEESKVTEIAKLISGEKVTESSIKSARELING